jgi:hypothetical protein
MTGRTSMGCRGGMGFDVSRVPAQRGLLHVTVVVVD